MYRVQILQDKKVFDYVKFESEVLAEHWYNQLCNSFKEYMGVFTVEMFKDEVKQKSFTYRGSGRYDMSLKKSTKN